MIRQWPHCYRNLTCVPARLGDADRAVALFCLIGGCAREKVFCQPSRVRQDCKALVDLLLWHFAPSESEHSLSTACNARM